MVPPSPQPEPLPPAVAARLTEFAKACRAAARIVSMYPASHPAIRAALTRMSDAARDVIGDGPFVVSVVPDGLLVGGRALPRAETPVSELAAMLHQHGIGALTLSGEIDTDGWHAFLSMLARAPEDARVDGGLATLWRSAGYTSLTMQAIDYSEVLRERVGTGAAATWDRIVGLLGGGAGGGAQAALAALAEDPTKLAEFTQRLQEQAEALGDDPAQQRAALLEMMHGLARHTSAHAPERLDSVLAGMTGAATKLAPDVLLTLMNDPAPAAPPGTASGDVDLRAELQTRATDEMIGSFLVSNVAKDRGATSRLAAAFTTLVPDLARQQDILSLAAEQAAAMFSTDPQFEQVWSSSSEMLMSYSDAQFVSEGYARELTAAQEQALDVDRIGDDPPDRIRVWLSTISEDEVRALDQRVLIDLLRIEQRPDAWESVLGAAIDDINQLVLIGDLPLAAELLETVVAAGQSDAPFAAAAAGGVTRLVEGPLVRNLALCLRQATDGEVTLANQMCLTIGAALVEPLSQALAAEDNPRTVRRLRDILIGFGSAAREYANKLRSSPHPAVRRAAVDLLRALGGDAALPDLRRMLDDPEPQVQREALRGIVYIGTDEAYQTLEGALRSGVSRTRQAIMHALGGFRDDRATPLFVYILTNTDHRGPFEPVYATAIELLGRLSGDERSIAALERVLHRGEWWAPVRTARLRRAAARALNSIGSAAAQRVLTDAASRGSRGVKRAARAGLAEAQTPRPARRTP